MDSLIKSQKDDSILGGSKADFAPHSFHWKLLHTCTKEQVVAAELYKPNCFHMEHYRGIACPTCRHDGMEHDSICNCMGCLQDMKPQTIAVPVPHCAQTPTCECSRCMGNAVYAPEEQ